MASVPLLSTDLHDDGDDSVELTQSGKQAEETTWSATHHRSRLRDRLMWWPALLALLLWVCTAVAYSVQTARSTALPLPLPLPLNETEFAWTNSTPAEVWPLLPLHPAGDFDRSKLAVIIEKRNLPVLIPVLLNFLVKVPDHWPFQIWCGRDNVESLSNSRLLRPFIFAGRLSIILLPNEDDIFDGDSLSKFLTAPWWWEQLAPARNIFFFQTDSLICANSDKSIDDFLGLDVFEGGYDWVGAPWDLRGYPSPPWGGNGGFSIRRRDTMLAITSSNVWNGQTEDVWFADRIRDSTGRFPTQQVAMEFAFESPPAEAQNLPWAFKTFGVHVGTGWAICRAFQDWEHIKKLLEWCPDAKLVMPNECIPP